MRRRRRDASAEEPDVCPCRQGSADQHLLSAAAVAGLGSSNAGELLLLRSAAGIHWGGGWIHWIHWGGVPPPKTLRSTLGQLEA